MGVLNTIIDPLPRHQKRNPEGRGRHPGHGIIVPRHQRQGFQQRPIVAVQALTDQGDRRQAVVNVDFAL